jgi:hypothetical protein
MHALAYQLWVDPTFDLAVRACQSSVHALSSKPHVLQTSFPLCPIVAAMVGLSIRNGGSCGEAPSASTGMVARTGLHASGFVLIHCITL